jgi:hypothetical protein
MVVPISRTRKAMRSGVMTKALTRRAVGVTGAMSPYPVVLSVTVV